MLPSNHPRTISLLISIIFLLAASSASAAQPSDKDMESLSRLTGRELLSKGTEYFKTDSLADRAIACFSIVSNRYLENPEDTSVRRTATEALRHLGNIYMTHEIDYRKAYRNLTLARQIAEEDGNDFQLAYIFTSLANLYNFNANGNDKIDKEAKVLLESASEAAIRSGNSEIVSTIIINLAITNESTKNWGDYAPVIKSLKRYSTNASSSLDRIALLVIEAMECKFNGDNARAEKLLTKAKSLTDDNIYSERILNSLDIMLIELYTETHQESKAIDLIRPMIDNAVENGLKDYEMCMYGKLTNIYDALGQQDSVEKYYSKYLVLKSEIEQRNGMHHVAEMDFISQIDKINSEVAELSLTRQKERRQHLVVICILIVITILLLSLLWVYANLKRNHRNLYIRNEEMNRREETHRLMREQLQNEIEQLRTSINSQTAESPKNENPETEEQLREDYARIVSWMEKSRDIYNPGFSLAKLASAMSLPSQAVSKAINVCHGMNFHQFLNEYRIREVTRLMHDRNSDNLTVESLSESVGFKSRTTFASLFKKTTGLTPTEYWKMAKQDKPGNQEF